MVQLLPATRKGLPVQPGLSGQKAAVTGERVSPQRHSCWQQCRIRAWSKDQGWRLGLGSMVGRCHVQPFHRSSGSHGWGRSRRTSGGCPWWRAPSAKGSVS